VTAPLRIAIVGYGKIAADQHVPAIAARDDMALVACVSRRRAAPAGVPAFADIADLRASGIAVDAVALCNTPEDRPATAHEAIAAGWHVLMEKPPAATLGAVAGIGRAARAAGVVLFASWHSRFAPAVRRAAVLIGRDPIRSLAIDWREDVRKWHPGQAWIWQPGGFGVFDPGINALSIITAILPVDLQVAGATLSIPADKQMPIAAEIAFAGVGVPADAGAVFDWRETAGERWTIAVATDRHALELLDGGARLLVDGEEAGTDGPGEYPALYARFAELVAAGESEVDVAPLRIVADAFTVGGRVTVEAFGD